MLRMVGGDGERWNLEEQAADPVRARRLRRPRSTSFPAERLT